MACSRVTFTFTFCYQVGTTVVNFSVILTETGQELLDGEVSVLIYVQGIEDSLKLLWGQRYLTAHSLSTNDHLNYEDRKIMAD